MQTDHKNLLEEISKIKVQYQKEVSGPRKTWPKSIRERVTKLDLEGVHARVIADASGIPYDTILQWRYQRNSDLKKSFRELSVVKESNLIDSRTVTVPERAIKNLESKSKAALDAKNTGTVTVTTPDGFTILVTSVASAIALLTYLRLRTSQCS